MESTLPIWYHLPVDNNNNTLIYRVLAAVFISLCAYITYNKLGQQKEHLILLLAASLNPLTVYYFIQQPGLLLQVVLIIIVAALKYENKQQQNSSINQFCVGCTIAMLMITYPSFSGLLFFVSKRQLICGFIIWTLLLFIAYTIGDLTVILGDQAFYDNFQSSKYTSLNMMFLLRSHLFLRYQELYTVFLGILPILAAYPLSRMPISKLNGIVVVIAMCIYVLPNCNFILILALLASFELFYQQITQNLFPKISQIKYAKILFLMRIITSVVLIVLSVINWSLIEKWRTTHQLNTGYLLLFQVILWIVPMVLLIQMTGICLQRRVKIVYNWELVQEQDDTSFIQIVKKYLLQRWQQL